MFATQQIAPAVPVRMILYDYDSAPDGGGTYSCPRFHQRRFYGKSFAAGEFNPNL